MHRTLFGHAGREGYFRGTVTNGGDIILYIGAIPSIEQGMWIEVYDEDHARLGFLQVQLIDANGFAIAPPASFTIPQSFYAKLAPNLSVYCEETHRELFQGILRKGLNSPTEITTGVTGVIDEADMEVSFQDDAIVLSRGLRDPIRRHDIREYPTTIIPDNTALILNVLRAAAHFKFHLESASNPLNLVQIEMAKIKFQWTEDAQLIRVRGSNILANNIANVVVNKDDRYGLTIRNETDLPLFPYVFYFDSDLSICEAISVWVISVTLITSIVLATWWGSPLVPEGSQIRAPLQARSEFSVGYKVCTNGDPWQFTLRDGETMDVGFFKIFLSTFPCDFSSIVQETPFLTGKRHGGIEQSRPSSFPAVWGAKSFTVVQRKLSDSG